MTLYREFVLWVAPDLAEALLGLVSDLPFDSFQETEEGWKAYTQEDPAEIVPGLEELQSIIPFEFSWTEMPQQAWNTLWESNFQPVVVDDFCGIRAEFHPSFEGAVKYELVIQPKMAFGTGHHETTYSVIQLMRDIDFSGKRVLDWGAGTGILAILAVKLGAAAADAVEIDPVACENARENVMRNGTEDIRVLEGSLETVAGREYGVIIANITRNVLLEGLPALEKMLPAGGLLLLSGFLEEDKPILEQAARDVQLTLKDFRRRNRWVAALFQK